MPQMIRRLSANNDDFSPIAFEAGLNLIVADRAPGASEQHSRNARGKTSILHAVNYCLGSNRPTSFNPLKELGWSFTLALDLFGTEVSATRDVKGGSRIGLDFGQTTPPHILADYVRDDGTVSLDEWKLLLGLGLFGLERQPEPGEHDISPRTLLSYMVRLDAPRDPTKILAQQPAWSSREHVAYLLGLDWRYTQQLSRMEQDADAFKAISYAREARLIPGLIQDESELLLRRAEIEQELVVVTEQAGRFVLLDDPQGTLLDSNRLASELTELTDDQVSAERLLMLYRQSSGAPDRDPDESVIGDVYRELGLVFSPEALRRFDEVEEFHRGLFENRQAFVQREISNLEAEVRARRPQIAAAQNQRQILLRQLSSGGGVDDLLELQRRVSEVSSRLQAVDEAIDQARQIQAARDALEVRQATCRRDAREDLNGHRRFLGTLNSRFSEIVNQLYGRAASINVDVDTTGYKFTIKVSGSSSTGITKMQLFSFDLTLLEVGREDRHPDFLIHDSTVFDGVDPRQVAGALNLVQETAQNYDVQYVATINTNDIPLTIKESDWYESCVKRVILDTEVGGAFGVVF